MDLYGAGNIAEQTMEQLYSEAAGKFLADRFVVGTCPKCKYEVSKGCTHNPDSLNLNSHFASYVSCSYFS